VINLQVVGQHERALQDFTRVLEMQPTNARALFRRAFSYKALKAYEEAAEVIQEMLYFSQDNASNACVTVLITYSTWY
jgi:tetratricopeptide (TPR) repeat protein